MKTVAAINTSLSSVSLRKYNVPMTLFCLGMFTVSFEIFLVFEYQFKFKFCYVPFLLAIFFALVKAASTRKFQIPLGFGWAILWSAFIAVFSVFYQFELLRNLGYSLWLFFSLGIVFSSVKIFDTKERVFQLIRLYILSFAFVSLFGALQFFIAIVGYPAPLHVPTAWWTSWLPRINAFMYEPSYYALYMLSGWVVLAYCIEKRLTIISPWKDKAIFLLITVTSLLSASRSGWLMMLLYALKFPLSVLRRHSRRQMLMLALVLMAASASAGFWLYVSGAEYLGVMLRGEDASPKIRMMALEDTVNIFRSSPLVGYGLGGVSSAIAEMRGYSSNVVDSETTFSGMSILAEALAASGMIGFFPFLMYMWSLARKPFRLAKRLRDPALGIVLKAVAISFVFAFIKLQFNQNILRPYFWLNIAVLSAVYSVAADKREAQ